MTVREYVIGEVEWLLNGGVHPTHIASALGTNVNALEKRLHRAGRRDLSRHFALEMRTQRKVAA